MADQGVTVVVPTLNRGGFLPDCLRDLLAQRHQPLEILVVDQSAEIAGSVATLIARHPDVISYHRVGFRGLPEARNYGWQHARYDAILFVDDDIRCTPELVDEHLKSLRLSGVGVVAGAIDEKNRLPDTTAPTGAYQPWTGTPSRGFGRTGEGDTDHAPGGNFSCWRRAIVAAGGVDEALNVGAALYEETDLCLRVKRAGFRVYFNGRARLTHLAAADGGCRVEQVADYTRALAHNRSILIRRHCRWYQLPVALVRLWGLCLSYALHYRRPKALATGLAGSLAGLHQGGQPPVYSTHTPRDAT